MTKRQSWLCCFSFLRAVYCRVACGVWSSRLWALGFISAFLAGEQKADAKHSRRALRQYQYPEALYCDARSLSTRDTNA